MVDGALDLGAAIATLLTRRYPHHTSGYVAQRMRCTKKAAENILCGHLSTRTATMIIEAFGPGFMVDAVMLTAATTLSDYLVALAKQAETEARIAAARQCSLLELAHSLPPHQFEGVNRS
jgi:hypothetical protein